MTDIVQTIYAYQGEHGLNFEAGDKIQVKERGENGWWRGTLLKNGDSTDGELSEKEGWFPSSYVENTEVLSSPVKFSIIDFHFFVNVDILMLLFTFLNDDIYGVRDSRETSNKNHCFN